MLPDPLAAVRRPTSKGRGREWRGWEGRGGKGQKRRGEGGEKGRMDGGGRRGMKGRDEGKEREGVGMGSWCPSHMTCLRHAPAGIAAAEKRPLSY